MQKIIDFFTLDPTDPQAFAAQLVGFIPLVLALVTFSLSKRKQILLSKTLSDMTSAVHFFLLGEVVGGAICVVNTARGFVFYNRGKKWASSIAVPIIFGVLTLASSLIRWEGVYSLLPAIGSLLAVIGFWLNEPRLVKLFNLPAVTLWLIYSIISGSISATLINIISIITIIVSVFTEMLKKRSRSSSEAEKQNGEEAV